MGGMGSAILENLEKYKIQMFRNTNVSERIQRCVVSDHGQDVQFHSAQPVISCQSKLTALIFHTFYI